MIRKDVPATAAAKFQDPRSYVCLDGRQILYGKDWKARKAELWARCQGRCEKIVDTEIRGGGSIGIKAIRCRSEAAHAHHVTKRSVKRDDHLEALIAYCVLHHELAHPEKQPRWTKKEALGIARGLNT